MYKGSSIDPAEKYIEVPCGRCMLCRIERKREWKNRLLLELDYWDAASFITLTYDEENVPLDRSLNKKALQDFFKRLRRRLGDKRIKYYAVGEYGDLNYRPHYHAIIFGCDDKAIIEDCWTFGFVKVGSVTHDSIQYVTGYITKKLFGDMAESVYGNRVPPFSLMSQGLGLRFVQDHAEQLKLNLGFTLGGVEQGLPRYFVKKLDIDENELRRKAQESMEEDIKRSENYVDYVDELAEGDVRLHNQMLYEDHRNRVNSQKALDIEKIIELREKREI